MARAVSLTETNLADLWAEVKDPDDFWQGVRAENLRLVKRILEGALESEMITWLAASCYERNPRRRGWRNGYYRRNVLVDLGLIENLRVPRARGPQPESKVLERYRLRQGQVNRPVRDMFLAGVSTRRVGEVLEPILGADLSAGTVSNIVAALDREVAAFLRQPLADRWVYLLLDGITLKVKAPDGVKKRLVLVAYAIDERGQRRILSFRLATAESEAQWEAFLNDLYQRGLVGANLRLAR